MTSRDPRPEHDTPESDVARALRRQAEARIGKDATHSSTDLAALTPAEIRRTLHELQVHQIELTMQNEELRRVQAEIDAVRARYFDLYDLAPVGYCTLSERGLILEANLTAASLLEMPKSALIKQPFSRFIVKDDQDLYYLQRKRLFETGEPRECDLRLVKPDDARVWVHLTATASQAEDGAPVCRLAISDITGHKRAGEELKEIEWMLTGKPPVYPSIPPDNDIENQGYGDLTALNRGGLISRSIDKGTLRDISSEYLNLLESSSAIYEKNGDYAFGIFCSGWCRLMDSASRKLCNTENNEAALASGQWLCHESCWTDCSKRAIESQSPVDIQCNGGIHLYAVPIFSAGEVIGAINFGYGAPPKDAATLRSLADSYGLDPETLANEADAYASRPYFFIALAKQRLLSSAGLIGIMVERKEHERRLEHLAQFDTLTALPNRVLLADRLHQAMAQTQRRGQGLAVGYLDLDGFKTINDRHGHEVGDQVLVAVAERLQAVLREGDTLARLGGDEFAVVLIDLTDPDVSAPLLERLLAAAAEPVRIGDLLVQVSASLGVTFYPQAGAVDGDLLLRQADQAMYQAKQSGKNRFCLFDTELDQRIRGHHEDLEQIRHALAARELVLYYQPKVNLRTGTVVGAEALIRWRHPQRGLLAPALFLPTTENHPLAVELGEWVIKTALAQTDAWRALGLALPVSVNVGARQLQQVDFVARLRALLAEYPGVAPSGLCLEILETSAIDDLVGTSRVIDACRELGVSVALDDFGTGYSSLTYLKRLAVTQLKIDKS
ncbi:EAL domain-containing protein, partial [Thiocapsa sp. N5-Cardenillas]